MIAPKMATSTAPPAPMLSKKLLSEGVTPDAASAASGTIMEAVRAAAVKAVTAFSLKELWTTIIRLAATVVVVVFTFIVNGLKKEVEGGRGVL